MTTSIMLVGVGGQGTILAGNLLSKGLLEAGYEVKVSEIVGMSQRGGSVSTHIRYGEAVASPVIEVGGCDIVIAFEEMEAVRYLHYLKPGGRMIVNTLRLPPTPVSVGQVNYPEGILDYLAGQYEMVALDAQAAAAECGGIKAANIVLLGAAAARLGLTNLDWETLIRENIKSAFVELNLKAFARGKALGEEGRT